MAEPSGIEISFAQKCIVTLWPSFLVAIAATGLFFSAFDPAALYPFDIDAEVSALGAYTVGFFVFWALCAVSSMITLYFAMTNCRKASSDRSSQQ